MKRILVFFVLLIAGISYANEPGIGTNNVETIANSPIPARDPIDLSIRLGGVDPDSIDIETRPVYEVGDTETFYIGGSLGTEVRQSEFVLAAAGEDVYLWVEAGMDYDQDDAETITEVIQDQIIPTTRRLFGEEKDIDGDPHVYVFNVFNAGPGIAGLYNDTDSYPNEIFDSSNEVNSLIMAVPMSDFYSYLSTWAHEFQHLVQAGRDDSEATWYIEGVAEVGSFLAIPEYFSTGFQTIYLQSSTGNQLNYWPGPEASTLPYYGGSSLFLTYVVQQYGEEWLYHVANEPADDIIGYELALEAYGAVDPLTGEIVTFNDIFADWVMANYLNDPSVGDGRYAHTLLEFSPNQVQPSLEIESLPVELTASSVKQYGTQYYRVNTEGLETLSLDFTGQAAVRILPTNPHSGSYFYWSQRGNQGDARLTGRFDLTEVSSATFNFSTWYHIEDLWDFGYISVSTDGGETWQVVTTPQMTDEDPYDRAFATGYSVTSGGGSTGPAPYIGVTTDDLLNITAVNPDTPAEQAGLQVNDRLFAIEGQRFSVTDFFSLIDEYQPGEEVTLTVLRDGQEVDVLLTLGTHPDRTRTSPIEWSEQSIDLTPFVGHEVLIRFDYVTDQATDFEGWLLDDVSIPEIGFFDDFEQENEVWTSEGWVRITNAVPQEYLLQAIVYGEETTVTRLVEPGAPLPENITLAVGGSEQVVLAVSGIAPVTRQPAIFDLRITAQ
ncbi:MAG: immune inhibitor A [Anaerolineae bacterium]|nr:immune inhibitor A [Anaerolineae bacterium]